jgi:hypothetical protein
METLHEAAVEMEAVQYEKRQLLHQWRLKCVAKYMFLYTRKDGLVEKVKSARYFSISCYVQTPIAYC